MRQNKPIWAVGLMSGTSLDGVDAASLLTNGIDIMEFGASCYQAYSDQEREILRSGLGKWPGDLGLEAVAALVGDVHLKAAQQLPAADPVSYTHLRAHET